MSDHETQIRGKYRVALACKLDERHEYLRRNQFVGKAEGVRAAMATILERAPKRTPKWLLKRVSEALDQMDEISLELAFHRNEELREP